MVRIIFWIVAALLLAGCAQMQPYDMRIDRAASEGRLRLGMSQREVAAAIGYEPLPFCKKSRVTERGTQVLWDLASRSCGANLMRSYALIFADDKLSEIRTVQTVLDLQLQ